MFTSNHKAIEKLIHNYFEGIFYGDIVKLKNCFHQNAILYGDIEGIDRIQNMEVYLEAVGKRQSPNDLGESLRMKIIGVDILGKTAMVKLHVPMLEYNYYDYLSLYKGKEGWKIVNKLYTHVN
ncbi:nuclear transport factor 2 family protein [Aquimarina spongiae]|uniref:Putative lumazine-binding n=1 Tax=Aquimarina spongiae TaxID=570521 RepID=A0A1M6CFX2_9FLAO|nr:nuclear transport factor 2 family protein [Aquimarina spongiae]SHI59935.1 Putative lumazine-binding [Aquimarina spongiae]